MASNLIKAAAGRAEEVRQQVEIALTKLPRSKGKRQVYLAPKPRAHSTSQNWPKGRRSYVTARASVCSASPMTRALLPMR